MQNSHRRCSIKKTVLKNFAIFTRKHLRWSLFSLKLQAFRPVTLLLKRDSNSVDFLWILRNFLEHLFWKTSVNGFFLKLGKTPPFLKLLAENWEVSCKKDQLILCQCFHFNPFQYSPTLHCVKRVRIRSFWSVFSRIWTEYGRSIFPYSLRMRENIDQKNSECGQFSRSAYCGIM